MLKSSLLQRGSAAVADPTMLLNRGSGHYGVPQRLPAATFRRVPVTQKQRSVSRWLPRRGALGCRGLLLETQRQPVQGGSAGATIISA